MRVRHGKTIGLVAAMLGGFLLLALYGASAGQEQSAPEARSVWDGAYTEAQAKRGEELYRKHCASCHGAMLTGGETASPLTGGAFLSNWNGLPLDELFERIRRSMPQDKPGKLNRQTNADILAYVLSVNKFPAGKSELPTQGEWLRQIKFETNKPNEKK